MRSFLVRKINNLTKTLSLRAKLPNTYGALLYDVLFITVLNTLYTAGFNAIILYLKSPKLQLLEILPTLILIVSIHTYLLLTSQKQLSENIAVAFYDNN